MVRLGLLVGTKVRRIPHQSQNETGSGSELPSSYPGPQTLPSQLPSSTSSPLTRPSASAATTTLLLPNCEQETDNPSARSETIIVRSSPQTPQTTAGPRPMSNPPPHTIQIHKSSPHSLVEADTCEGCESQKTAWWSGPISSPNTYGHSVGARKDIENSRPSAENSAVRELYDYRPIRAESLPLCAELPHSLETQSLGYPQSPRVLQYMGITDNQGPGQKPTKAAETSISVMHENQTVTKGGSSIIKIRIPRQIHKVEPVDNMYTQDTAEEQSDGKLESSNIDPLQPPDPPSQPQMPHLGPYGAGKPITKVTGTRKVRKRNHSEISKNSADTASAVQPSQCPPSSVKAVVTTPRQTPESIYARRYTQKKPEIVTESMLPKFTMCPRTIDLDTCNAQLLLGAKGKSEGGGQYVRETAKSIDEGLQVVEKRPSDSQEVAATSKFRWVDKGTSEDMVGAEQNHRGPPLPVNPTISVEQQTAITFSGIAHNANTLAQTLESQTKISNPVEALDEARPYMKPYKSTFFYPLLDDYYLPGSQRLPPFSWHTEKPTHPIPAISASTPANVMGSMDSNGETFGKTHGEDTSQHSELLELLTPMTDEEQDSNLTDTDSDSEDSQSPLLRFPRNASREVVKSYALLANALKLGLEKRDEVLENFEQEIESNSAGVEMQEEWEKKEKWLERSRGPGGTRSRGGAGGLEYPDFLDWLRQRGREE